ncbi:MAG TPA: prenyltransferase [Anaerolineae bacterium]|nr:prenyltransferase [Anaerolineae bacterium]HNT05170.1 prenyltransferase [Anaerolineae bacterium]
MSKSALGTRLGAWIALARPAFHSVAVLPFVLGTVVAWRTAHAFRWPILAWGVAGVVLILLATYFAGEYWDVEEDTLSGQRGPSRFAGGSQVVQRGLLPRQAPLYGSLLCLGLAVGVGLLLQFGYGTGGWTLPLGLLGALGGFFYSSRPVRWVRLGWGELWIAFCYGWLPVAVGCYLQAASLPPVVHWLALPIGWSILNVILLNEFPDYPADLQAGKANLAVRLGLEKAARLYVLVAVVTWVIFALSLVRGAPRLAAALALPAMAASVWVTLNVQRARWRDRSALEQMCAANLAVNLGLTAAYILGYVW